MSFSLQHLFTILLLGIGMVMPVFGQTVLSSVVSDSLPVQDWVQWHGSLGIQSQYSTLPGNSTQLLPPNYLRFDLRNKLTLGGVPLELNAFWTTESNVLRQNMNYITFNFNKSELLARLKRRAEQHYAGTLDSMKKTLDTTEARKRLAQGRSRLMGRLGEEKGARLKALESRQDSLRQKIDGLHKKIYSSSQAAKVRRLEDSLQKLDRAKEALLSEGTGGADALRSGRERLSDSVSAVSGKGKEVLERAGAKGSSEQERWAGLGDSVARSGRDSLLGRGNRWRERKLAVSRGLEDSVRQVANFRQQKDSVCDPERIKSLAGQRLISQGEKMMLHFKSLSIGQSSPYYSDFSLSGVPLMGASFEYKVKQFYFGSAGGRHLRPVMIGNNGTGGVGASRFSRTIFGGTLGWERGSGHVHFNVVYGKDDASSDLSPEVALSSGPRENMIAGLDFGFMPVLWGRYVLEIEGEIHKSLLSTDHRLNGVRGEIGRWVTTDHFSNRAVSGDYAGQIKLKLQLSGRTKLTGGMKKLGAGYQSMGSPFLRVGAEGYELGLEQRLGKGWEVRLLYRQETLSGLVGSNAPSVVIRSANVVWKGKLWKKVDLSGDYRYVPLRIAGKEQDTSASNSDQHGGGVQISGHYRFLGLKQSSMLLIRLEERLSTQSILRMSTVVLQYRHMVEAGRRVRLTGGGGYTRLETYYLKTPVYTGEFSAGVRLLKSWVHTVGGVLQVQTQGSKTVLFYHTSIKAGKHWNFTVKSDYNLFSINGSYWSNFIFHGGLQFLW